MHKHFPNIGNIILRKTTKKNSQHLTQIFLAFTCHQRFSTHLVSALSEKLQEGRYLQTTSNSSNLLATLLVDQEYLKTINGWLGGPDYCWRYSLHRGRSSGTGLVTTALK